MTERHSLSRLELGLILAVAALPRLVGLGHVSLWLDEILSSLRVGRDLAGAWEAWRGDPVHPPLSELLQWLWFRLVEPEPLRRLLPVALGVLTVGLLAHLACRWFGRRAAWATGLIAAMSPLHVHYSQELRGYALGLLAIGLALATADLAAERRSWSGWASLGLALSLCYWSLYISVFVLVPIVLTVLQVIVERSTWRRELGGFALALMLSVALFSPWLSGVQRAAAKVHEQQATEWTWSLLGSRWQFLTVGGAEGDPLSAGAVLFAVLVTLGVVAASGSLHGRSVIAGALAGSLGVEVVLWLTDHWSNGRYSLVSWPFLVMLAGLGCARIHDLVTRPFPARLGSWMAVLPLLAALLGEAAGVADYFRRGRPDWQSVARAASSMAAPDRPILVSNEWTRLSLGYYLALLEGSKAGISNRPQVVDSSGLIGEGCVVLVAAGWSKSPVIEELLLETPARRDFSRSGARVAAVGRGSEDPWRCLPEEVEIAGERPAPRGPAFGPLRPQRTRGLELTAEDQPHLRFGWSYSEQTPSGMTYRWAIGRWAAVDLPVLQARTLRFEAWSLSSEQVMSVYVGRRLLATVPLSTSRQSLEVPLPISFGGAGDETIVFGFTHFASRQENPRPLAVAFDRIELRP